MGIKGMKHSLLDWPSSIFLNGAHTKHGFINLISKTAFKEYDNKEEGIILLVYLKNEIRKPKGKGNNVRNSFKPQ